MPDQILVCPNCGSDRLFSSEETTIDYPIRATAKSSEGEPTFDYTGADRITNDEGTQYRDKLWCRECLWEGGIAALSTLREYAHRGEPMERVLGVEEDSDRGADVRWQGVCRASWSIEGEHYECGWCGSWQYAGNYVERARHHNVQADKGGRPHTDPGQLAYEQAELDVRQHLLDEGVRDALG